MISESNSDLKIHDVNPDEKVIQCRGNICGPDTKVNAAIIQ
jgi:hypothetical protein